MPVTISSGKDAFGEMQLIVTMRDNGKSVKALTVNCVAFKNPNSRITLQMNVLDEDDNILKSLWHER